MAWPFPSWMERIAYSVAQSSSVAKTAVQLSYFHSTKSIPQRLTFLIRILYGELDLAVARKVLGMFDSELFDPISREEIEIRVEVIAHLRHGALTFAHVANSLMVR